MARIFSLSKAVKSVILFYFLTHLKRFGVLGFWGDRKSVV
jgi:hypothetical protein